MSGIGDVRDGVSSFFSHGIKSFRRWKNDNSVELTKDSVEFSKPETVQKEFAWPSAELAKKALETMWDEKLFDIAKEKGSDRTSVMVDTGRYYIRCILGDANNPFEASLARMALKRPYSSHPVRADEDRKFASYKGFGALLGVLSTSVPGPLSLALAKAGTQIMEAFNAYDYHHSLASKAGRKMLDGIAVHSRNPQEVLVAETVLKTAGKTASYSAYKGVLGFLQQGIPEGTPVGVTLGKAGLKAMDTEYRSYIDGYGPSIGFENTAEAGRHFLEAIAKYSRNPRETMLANLALEVKGDDMSRHHTYLTVLKEIASGITTPAGVTLARIGKDVINYDYERGDFGNRIALGRHFMKAIQEHSENPKDVALASEKLQESESIKPLEYPLSLIGSSERPVYISLSEAFTAIAEQK